MSSQEPKRILVLATGGKVGGGSGLRWLIDGIDARILRAQIVGVGCNYKDGGVDEIARTHKPNPLRFFPLDKKPLTAEDYQYILDETKPDFIFMSGFLKKTIGLPPAITGNIHPGLLSLVDAQGNPKYGGQGMHGHHVHDAVVAAREKISGVTMHFVTSDYDRGPAFFEFPVAVRPEDTGETLGKRVNEVEHGWQAFITNKVVTGQIRWDGIHGHPVEVTADYLSQPYCPKSCVLMAN